MHRAVRNVEDPRHQLRAVAVRPRDEELAAVGAGRASEFECEVREIGDAHCAYGLREGGEVFEDGGVGHVFGGVLEVAGSEPELAVGDIRVAVDQGGVGIVGVLPVKASKAANWASLVLMSLYINPPWKVPWLASSALPACSSSMLHLPELALLESSRLECSDDAEVVGAAFEG